MAVVSIARPVPVPPPLTPPPPIESLPDIPPFQPPIPDKPGVSPPEEGKEFIIESRRVQEADGFFIKRFVSVTKFQKWRRKFVITVECDNEIERTQSYTFGISRTKAEEVAFKLGVEVEGIGSELSSKLSTSVTVAFEDKISFTIKSKAPKCKKRTLVIWQLVDVYKIEIDQSLPGSGSVSSDVINFEIPSNVFDEAVKDYESAECCPRRLLQRKRDGFKDAYTVSFNEASFVLLGKTNDNGRISFADIDGEFQPGGLIPFNNLSNELKSSYPPLDDMPELTFATFRKLNDPAEALCDELGFTTAAGFARTENKIVDIFNNATRDDFIEATRGASKVAVDKIIATRKNGGFPSLQSIEGLDNITKVEIFQLMIPIITKGELVVEVPGIVNGPLSESAGELEIIEGVGPKTGERLSNAGFNSIESLASANRKAKIPGVRDFGYIVDSARIIQDLSGELNSGDINFQDVQVIAELYCGLSAAIKANDTKADIQSKIENINLELPKDYNPEPLHNLLRKLQ